MNENILCSMTGCYYNSILEDTDKLCELSNGLLNSIIMNSSIRTVDYVMSYADSDYTGGIVPVRVNLVLFNDAYSAHGVTMVHDEYNPHAIQHGVSFIGGFIDKFEDFYGSYNFNDDDVQSIVYRALIRGVLEWFTNTDDYSMFNVDTLDDCRYVLKDLLHRYAGVPSDDDIMLSDMLYYWYSSGCINICLFCKCDAPNVRGLFIPRGLSLGSGTGNDFVRAVFNTPNVFQSSV